MKATNVLCQSIAWRVARRPLTSQRRPLSPDIAASHCRGASSSLSRCRLTHSRRPTLGC